MAINVDDLLGFPVLRTGVDVDDLLGPRTQRRKKRSKKSNGGKYRALTPPKKFMDGGIWDLREKKGQNLGRTCLICKDPLKHKRGRPPIVCGKNACFRAYRNAYRAEYDRARGD